MGKSNMPAVLVTGATGNIGSELTKQLAARNIPFRAMVRSPAGARGIAALENAELVAGDFNDEETVDYALTGIDRAFLLTSSSAQAQTQQTAFVEAARRAGTRHIVKLSQWAADADSPVRFLRYHAAVEQKIRNSGIAFTFLRPNLFMQGLLGFRDPMARQGKFFAAIGGARVSAVDVRDIAAVALAALTRDGHEGKTYDITGPEALTHQAMAEKLSDALHRRIIFEEVAPEAMRDALAAFSFPEWQADGLIEDYAHYAREEADAVTNTVADVTGQSPYSFDDFARDYAHAFA